MKLPIANCQFPIKLSIPKLFHFRPTGKWKMENGNSKGFTLIELLVVISIIGVLAALALGSYTYIQQQARNTQRKNDLKQYQTALENYAANKNSLYPKNITAAGVPASSTLCGYLAGFIATPCPSDPRGILDAAYEYKYQSDGTGTDGAATGTKWALWAKLEGGTNFWVVCSNGGVGEKAQSGFSVSGGGCPL